MVAKACELCSGAVVERKPLNSWAQNFENKLFGGNRYRTLDKNVSHMEIGVARGGEEEGVYEILDPKFRERGITFCPRILNISHLLRKVWTNF